MEKFSKNKSKKRVSIFTVNMSNRDTIQKDLQILANYGSDAFKGVGTFDGPLEMLNAIKKSSFKIDKGAIITEELSPLIYKEMINGTASESSIGAMELQTVVVLRIQQDWGMWINQNIIMGLIDLYIASTLMYIDKQYLQRNKTH